MLRSESPTSRLLVILAVCTLGCGAALASPSAEVQPWCTTLFAPELAAAQKAADQQQEDPQPTSPHGLWMPTAATYEVDVFGSIAYGRLALEYANTGDVDLSAWLITARPLSLAVGEFESATGSEEAVEPLEVKFSSTSSRKPSRRAAAAQKSQEQKIGLAGPLSVAAGESITVGAAFEVATHFANGRFALSLPPVAGLCELPATEKSGPLQWNATVPVSVELRIHHPEPLDVVESSSHELLWDFESDRTVVELVTPDPDGDRSFELAYALGREDESVASGFVSPPLKGGERDVLVVVAPAFAPSDESIRPKETLFVVDTSGSMQGDKIVKAREALGYCLELLGGGDRFNLVEFDSLFTTLFEEPVVADPGNLIAAEQWLAAQGAGGGTQLMPALAAAFEQPHDAEHHRLVVVLTDGALGDKDKVLELLQQKLGEARLFFVGIGDQPKRDTILELAEYGRGSAAFADDPAGFAAAVQQLFAEVASPLAWDLNLDLGGAEIVDIEPSRLPDLYAGRPVTVRARVRGELPAELTLEATTTEGAKSFRIPLPGEDQRFPGMRRERSRER